MMRFIQGFCILIMIMLGLAGLATNRAHAEREHFPPKNAPLTFIGVVTFEGRYSGHEAWTTAAWGGNDPLLRFKVSDKKPWMKDVARAVEPVKATDFTMLETGYEFPAVLVYERLGDWAEVLIAGKRRWIQLMPGDKYIPYPALFDEGKLAFLVVPNNVIAGWPGGTLQPLDFAPGVQGYPIDADKGLPDVIVLARAEIVEYTDAGPVARHWFKIRVPNVPSCGDIETPGKALAEGWIPAYRDDGRIAVWFHSRGC